MPNDTAVSALFQTNLTTSRTLIRNAFAKYRYQLESAEKASIVSALETGSWGDDFLAEMPPNLLEPVNRRLKEIDPNAKPVAASTDAVGIYSINKFSYNKLCKALGAKPVENKK